MKQFQNVDTTGIKHGQRFTAADFRKLAKTEVPHQATQQSNKSVNNAKPKAKTNKKPESGLELPWFTLFLEEKLRLEADPDRLNRDREYYYQVTIMAIVAETYPELEGVVHASPNGGDRNPLEAKRLKRAGAQRGHPDLQFMVAKSGYHGLFIELKKEFIDYGKKPETGLKEVHIKQHFCRIALLKQGFLAVACYGVAEALAVIKAYMSEQPIPSEVTERWDSFDWQALAKRN